MTREVKIGNIKIGAGNPIAVQSMTRSSTKDVGRVVEEIRRLEMAGCEIVRVAVPNRESGEAIDEIRRKISIPLVADIHFNWRLALIALEKGADKIRINPGTIGSREAVREIVKAAKDRGVPIRIGVNAGSLPKDILKKYKGSISEAMVASAIREVEILEEKGFQDIVVSLKAFDIPTTVSAYEKFSQLRDYPLHIGITEAGPMPEGAVRSAVGLGILLSKGLGDTIRVSLTADGVKEVEVAWEILSSLNLRKRGYIIVSCPMCARCSVPLIEIVERVREELKELPPRPLKVAVMGCEVNGPGEAKDADIGLAFGKVGALLFVRGKPIKTVAFSKAIEVLREEIRKL
jgi:(E)-4-hydroxy-3-methylbut-2-enyl-diphosphate synthase